MNHAVNQRSAPPAEHSVRGQRIERLVKAGEGEAPIAGQETVGQGRPGPHLPEDDDGTFDGPVENLRMVPPQPLGADPLPEDADQLAVRHGPSEGIQRRGAAQVGGEYAKGFFPNTGLKRPFLEPSPPWR